MTEIRKSALVPYSAAEMYALVADVESYPHFLPWCGGSQVLSQEPGQVVAAVDIAYSGVSKRFTTRNRLTPDERIDMHLLDGPFSRLEGQWQFQALGESESKILFRLEFEFASRLVGLAFGSSFGKIADSMVDGFLKRAGEVYGRR